MVPIMNFMIINPFTVKDLTEYVLSNIMFCDIFFYSIHIRVAST